ncbi:hypothetical protein TNCT_547321 [Trichonephila clavata]|uniref:Uncharacterized protein n=1 Tax=Trichonephila clavata TaxID=2740835 RepID=A0A8X6J2D0_TRICU|nr:hypothetical protein TNCT_547321 [Trichonephila clavata]
MSGQSLFCQLIPVSSQLHITWECAIICEQVGAWQGVGLVTGQRPKEYRACCEGMAHVHGTLTAAFITSVTSFEPLWTFIG